MRRQELLWRAVVLSAFALTWVASAAWGLGPDEILLLTNRNVPESAALAEFYRAARLIPQGRIAALDLPSSEEIPAGMYRQNVVPAVRQFMEQRDLRQKVRCIVTFYGLPLRVAGPGQSEEHRKELAWLRDQQQIVMEQIRGTVSQLEEQARRGDAAFQAATGHNLEQLGKRADAALAVALRRLKGSLAGAGTDGQQIMQAVRELHGWSGLLRLVSGPAEAKLSSEPGAPTLSELAQRVRRAAEECSALRERPFESDARRCLRELVKENFGKLALARLLEGQVEQLSRGNQTAAFDSELALLWRDGYELAGWQDNPMYYAARRAAADQPIVMVMRLDAPQSGMVREMILASLKAEREGLKGRVVLDCRGLHSKIEDRPVASYNAYDQSIRNLGQLIRSRTKLGLLQDESPQTLPAGSAEQVALYCGWYSVRNYTPSCRFNPGAVGFHVASFELVSLRNPQEKGWVAGLIRDGVAATMGPVTEPYLLAFPAADDFFPLLLTGRLTLAEVYWRTCPTTSWMMCMIGDPLYRPYMVNPQLRAEDLPARLQSLLVERPADRHSSTGAGG